MSPQEVIAIFARAGFRVEDTGGGCDAFVRDEGDDVIVVTEDACIPESLDDVVGAWRHKRVDWEEGTWTADPREEFCGPARDLLARYI